ncbi:peroxiredoxin [Candidatus Thiothrix anitrata]|uniref:peroxiredoxin n=1 Tax=Candidatus Thiothrix anitrata TaxID=2823902 RepID=UPI0038990B3A
MTIPTLGNPVPDFSLAATSGKTFRLSEFKDKALVVLYFYPKDSTPGCTTEGQDFRDVYPQFVAAGVEIFGISRDSLKSHENFKAKQAFPFELLADTEELACQLFDVIKMKNMYGKQVRGIERSTFLIDQQGVLRREWRKLTVKGHVTAVLAAVECAFIHLTEGNTMTHTQHQHPQRLFVLDTNVLMHDPTALFRFQEHDVFLPMVVLEELDQHKKGVSEVARNVRQVSRFINDMLSETGIDAIHAGISLLNQRLSGYWQRCGKRIFAIPNRSNCIAICQRIW